MDEISIYTASGTGEDRRIKQIPHGPLKDSDDAIRYVYDHSREIAPQGEMIMILSDGKIVQAWGPRF